MEFDDIKSELIAALTALDYIRQTPARRDHQGDLVIPSPPDHFWMSIITPPGVRIANHIDEVAHLLEIKGLELKLAKARERVIIPTTSVTEDIPF
jgi:hypothetical protein